MWEDSKKKLKREDAQEGIVVDRKKEKENKWNKFEECRSS